ncbi:MAG: hypothetical protein D6679_08355 [Candidatus Hydrogenedentota bacterium]|nr:MAG: hypothetical protein D6679_08355 [Candidatus Hydrogenedentota bacterium]
MGGRESSSVCWVSEFSDERSEKLLAATPSNHSSYLLKFIVIARRGVSHFRGARDEKKTGV